MDLREQKYVCTLAETGNLTRAAELLCISQPALSNYISGLEKNLGSLLFDRVGKKLVLTYAGERYVAHARAMLNEARAFDEELYSIRSGNRGKLRIGISLRRGPYLLPPVLSAFEAKWPEVEVIIRDGNLTTLYEHLYDLELDLIILNADDVTDGMTAYPLFKEEFLLVVPALHPINEKARCVAGSKYRMIDPAELNGQCLILQTSLQSSRKIEDEVLRLHCIKPSRIREIRSFEMAVRMAAEGLGITFIREGYAAYMKLEDRVNYYMLDTESHQKEVVIAHKNSIAPPGYMKDMILLLQQSCRGFPE